jgi:hypothetical protein
MFDFGLTSNPFSFDTSAFGFATAPGLPGVVSSGSQTTSIPAGSPWYQSLATLGLDGFKSWLNFDLGQQQVKAGQYPSQNATVANLQGAASNLSGLIVPLVIVLVVVFAFRALFGKKR